MSKSMTVASLQMIATPDLERNLDIAQRLIGHAAKQGARMVLLPEYFCLMGHKDTDKLAIAEPIGNGPIQQFLADQAVVRNLHIVAGTLPIASEVDGRVYNTTLVFNPQGQCTARYDKIHLFCFTKGQESYDEARVLLPGKTPVVADIDGFKVEDIYRVELELKVDKNPIPWDVIERRDQYFAGAYPFFGDILPNVEADILQRRPERAIQADLAMALENCRIQFGPTLFTAMMAYQGDITAVWDKVVGKAHNRALVEAGVLMVDHD